MKTKKVNSNKKGKRIELEFVNFLKERGFHAARSQQYCGKNGDADVNVEELSNFHFEVKGGHQVPAKIYKFMEQAVEDSKGEKIPLCILKRDREDFLVVMRGEEWFEIFHSFQKLSNAFSYKFKEAVIHGQAELSEGLLWKEGTSRKKEDYILDKEIECDKLWANLPAENLELTKTTEKILSKSNNYGRGIVEESEEF